MTFQTKNKILYVSSSSDNHTGSPKALLDLAGNLDKSNYSVNLIVPQDGPLAQDFKRVGGEVFFRTSQSLTKSNLVSYMKSIKEFWFFLKENQISLVHYNGIGWRESLVVAARLAGVPVLLNLHNPYPETDIKGNYNLSLASKIVIVSESMRDNFKSHPGILKKIICIYNGVDLKRFDAGLGGVRNALPVKGGPIVGYVGQMCQRKGVDLLIKAAPGVIEKLPDALFVFVGSDGVGEEGYTDRMKTLTTELGIADRSVFLGKRDDIPEVMNAFDLLVVPSRAEPFGKVIIEGMACGKCVVATAVGGIPEIIQDGRNGLLVPAENSPALSEAMIKVFDDSVLREALAYEGCRTAREQFSIDALVGKTQGVYTNLIHKTCEGDDAGKNAGVLH